MRTLYSAALGLALTLPVIAQSDTAQISGFVRDATGSSVPKASVVVTNEATGLERRAATSESGYYTAPNLPPGLYTVTVEAPGFKRYVSTANKLDPSIAAGVDVELVVGPVTESVQVTASRASLQVDTAAVGKLVETEELRSAVLNGRNPLYLVLMKPGVRGGSLAGFTFGLGGQFNVNGARSDAMLVTYDGAVAVRTRGNGTTIGVPDVDTVQDIQILTANFNAEYGRSTGGQLRVVTRSGAKQFHGSLYEYFRNDKLDANSWTRNRTPEPRPAGKFNQFGYVVSGPAYVPGKWNTDRRKLFFLWAQEWVRFRQEVTSTITVPSLAMRRGDFSELLDAANPFFGRVRAVTDPDTGRPFDNNVIPAGRLSPNGLGLLRAYPEPTPGFLLGRFNFLQTRPQPQNQRKNTLSLDFLPSANHTFRFRHQAYAFLMQQAFAGGMDRGASDLDRPNQTASLHHIWVAGPSTVNELLITASVDRVHISPQAGAGCFRRACYGITFPYVFPERKQISDRIPNFALANFQGLNGPNIASSSGPIYALSNNTTKVAGAHSWKWGVSFERSGQNDRDQPPGAASENGRFEFQDVRAGGTGLAVANTALGLFNNYDEIGNRAYTPYRGQMFEAFVQDSWKATPKLRVEAGLRYTLQQPYYYSLWRNMAAFDARRYDPGRAATVSRAGLVTGGDRYSGVVIPGSGFPDSARGRVPMADTGEFNHLFSNGGKTFGELQKLEFQPRLGIAYRIHSQTVVRAGAGRFLARPAVSDSVALGANPPFQPNVSIMNGRVDNPSSGQLQALPFSFVTTDPVFKIPSSYKWSVTVERLLGRDTTASIAYVGTVGLHMERERNINQLPAGTTFRPENAGVNAAALRPYKGYAAILLAENAARSAYHSLQLELNRRFARGLGYGFSYTYSSSFDNASNRFGRVYDAYDDRSFWGPSAFDTRHNAAVSVIYSLPFFSGGTSRAGRLLGGWRVASMTQFQTGNPVTAGTPDDFAGVAGAAGGPPVIYPWNATGDPGLPRGEKNFSQGVGDSNFYFRTRNPDGSLIFTRPALGAFATTQTRNALLTGPGFQNWNLALFKDFPVRETHRMEFRAEFFNWVNHPNWAPVDSNPPSSTFGKVIGKLGERNVQLSLRYSF